MSTWTSKHRLRRGLRPAAALYAVLVLPGCLGDGDGPAFLSGGARAAPPADGKVLSRAALGAGEVALVPPRGYCIDTGSLANKKAGGFALLASCESLTGRLDGLAVLPAVITVSVSARSAKWQQPDAQTLASAVEGATAISEMNGNGLSLVHVDGAAASAGKAGDTRHWRGVMVINQRLVGLAVYGARGSKIAGPEGEALLVAVAESLRVANPYPSVAAPKQGMAPEQASEGQVEEPIRKPAERRGIRAVFGRLFP